LGKVLWCCAIRPPSEPVYLLAPDSLLLALVVLATAATVIASQATISGAFSITQQASRLGYLPRIDVRHTSDQERGQIYVGSVNWIMLIGVLLLVLEFRSSSAFAAAYGIAVSGTMIITSILVAIVLFLTAGRRRLSLLTLLAFSSFSKVVSRFQLVQGGRWRLVSAAVRQCGFPAADDLEERLITGGATTQCDRPAGSGYCRERTAGHSTGPRHSGLPGV
jgi:K+ transporter